MSSFEFCEYVVGSSTYEQELDLRHHVLRLPIGLTLSEEDKKADIEKIHLGALFEGQLAACVLAKDLGEGQYKLSQMAVSQNYQGAGLGRQLLAYAEDQCMGRGARAVVLNARGNAVGFYEKCGYQIISDEFTEVGIATMS